MNLSRLAPRGVGALVLVAGLTFALLPAGGVIDVLVTEAEPSQRLAEALRAADVEVVVASAPSSFSA